MMIDAHPLADFYPSMSPDRFDELVETIGRDGLLEPIVLYQGLILDGRHRYRAVMQLQEGGHSIEPDFVPFEGDELAAAAFIQAKHCRRDMDVTQRACVGVRWKEFYQEKYPQGGDRRSEQFQGGNITTMKNRDRAAKIVDVSGKVIDKAAQIKRDAPALYEAMADGGLSVWDAERELKRECKQVLAEALNAQPLPAPTGRFNVIVADPPWAYVKRVEDNTHRARLPYPDMTQEEILALPVSELAEENCILWLWTTNAFLRDALDCVDEWGFTQKTMLTWAKDRMGCGDWLRGQTEHCLMAVKGNPIVMLTNQTTLLHGPLREHSRKPDSFFEMVNALCPGTKLEMFCREARQGWQAWGIETEKFSQ